MYWFEDPAARSGINKSLGDFGIPNSDQSFFGREVLFQTTALVYSLQNWKHLLCFCYFPVQLALNEVRILTQSIHLRANCQKGKESLAEIDQLIHQLRDPFSPILFSSGEARPVFLRNQRLPGSFTWRHLERPFSPTLHSVSPHSRTHLERSHLQSRLDPLGSNKDKTSGRCPFCYLSGKGMGPEDHKPLAVPTCITRPCRFHRDLAMSLCGLEWQR